MRTALLATIPTNDVCTRVSTTRKQVMTSMMMVSDFNMVSNVLTLSGINSLDSSDQSSDTLRQA